MADSAELLNNIFPDTTPAFIKMTESFEQADVLEVTYDTQDRSVAQKEAQRDAEQLAKQETIDQIKKLRSETEEEVEDLWEDLSRQTHAADLVNEELVFMNGLLATRAVAYGGRHHYFDFSKAQHDLEHYRQLLPATKVMAIEVNGSETDDPDRNLPDIVILAGGILATKPTVCLALDTSPLHLDPVISLPFEGGIVHASNWSGKRAIGDQETDQATRHWIAKAQEEYYEKDQRYPQTLLETLVILSSCKIDFPEFNEFREQVVRKYELGVITSPDDFSWLRYLPDLAQIDIDRYNVLMGKLVPGAKHRVGANHQSNQPASKGDRRQ